MLPFLAQIQSWHLVAAGLAGAALCIGLGRTAVLALIGATLCGAIALAGIVDMWRSYGAPDRIVIVAARTVSASAETATWIGSSRTRARSFCISRRSGGSLWIDGIRILASNQSDRPLTNLRGVVRSPRSDKEMKMNLALDDRQLDVGEAQTVPPKSKFSMMHVIPSVLDDGPSMLDDGASGIPAAQFVRAFGDLYFMFGYDTNQMFSRLLSIPEIEQKILRIERESDGALPAKGSL
jgi:hypothetical protein